MRSISLVVLVSVLGACGSKTGLPSPPVTDDAGTDVPTDVPALDVPVLDAPVDTFDAGQCIPFRSRAELASLDIFMLVDTSGSMEQLTSDGITKAEALTRALDGFLAAEASTGIGAALTFFPIEDLEVSEYCDEDDDCGGEPDSCFAPDICLNTGEICREGSICDDGTRCVPLGRCAAVAGEPEFCIDIGGLCDGMDRCIDFGLCENRTSCDLDDYREPLIQGVLPEAGTRIVRALQARELGGSTPTLPALAGVLEAARRQNAENPGNKVIVLLATDGFPAACDEALPDPFDPDPDPTIAIAAPSEIAAAGAADGVETFVIGVFQPETEREARENLSRLAEAGGSEEALIVTTDGSTSERLLEVLTEVRAEVRTCVYAIPAAGAVPDPRDLDVRLLVPGRPLELVRVDNEAECVPDGFYFQQDIEMGARPGFLELCPEACETAATDEIDVEMESGCSR